MSCDTIRTRLPARRTLPSSSVATSSAAPISRRLWSRALNRMTEPRPITLSERIFESWAITSSVIPSAKNSFSGSALRFWKGSTATDGSRGARATVARPASASANAAAVGKRAGGLHRQRPRERLVDRRRHLRADAPHPGRRLGQPPGDHAPRRGGSRAAARPPAARRARSRGCRRRSGHRASARRWPARGSCSPACRSGGPVSVSRSPGVGRRRRARCRSRSPSPRPRGAGCSPA